MKNAPSDFELLILLVEKLKEFTYEELQKNAKKIQNKYRLFQEYFNNSEDIEGVAIPESLRLSFHFKVLYEMGYIKRNGTQYVVSPKCKEELKKIRNTYPDSTSIDSLIAIRLH